MKASVRDDIYAYMYIYMHVYTYSINVLCSVVLRFLHSAYAMLCCYAMISFAMLAMLAMLCYVAKVRPFTD
jgi:hypothetical protein